jgi:hypothetical protein
MEKHNKATKEKQRKERKCGQQRGKNSLSKSDYRLIMEYRLWKARF